MIFNFFDDNNWDLFYSDDVHKCLTESLNIKTCLTNISLNSAKNLRMEREENQNFDHSH